MHRTVLPLLLPFLLLVAIGGAAFSEDQPEPEFADKPASWWVEQALDGDQKRAAREVLRGMGRAAALHVARGLPEARSAQDRMALLELLDSLVGRDAVVAAQVAPFVRPSLTSKNSREAARALSVVTRAGAAAGGLVEDVGALLDSPTPGISRQAARALGAFGAAARPWVPGLAAMLGSDDDAVRLAALHAITQLERDAIVALPELLAMAEADEPDPAVVLAIACVAPDDPRAAEIVVRAFAVVGEQRRELRDAVAALEPGDVLRAVATSLAVHENPGARVIAAEALARLAGESGQPLDELFTLLRDPDGNVVGAACVALQRVKIERPAALVEIGDALRASAHPSRFMRLLYSLRPAIGPQLVLTVLSGEQESVNVAQHVISRSGAREMDIDPERFLGLLLDPKYEVERREYVLLMLESQGALTTDGAHDLLVSILQEGEAGLATRAAYSLRGDAARCEALIDALDRPEGEVRRAALDSLGPLAQDHDDVRLALAGLLSDEDEILARQAFWVLCDLRMTMADHDGTWRAQLIEALPRYIADPYPHASSAALRALWALPADAVPLSLLLDLIREDRAAEQAIEKLRTASDVGTALQGLLADDDPVVAARGARVWLARKLDADAVLPALKSALRSDDVRVRRAAVIATSYLDDDRLVTIGGALLDIVRARDSDVSWRACAIVSRIAVYSPDIAEVLLEVAADPEHPAHGTIASSLPALGERGELALLKLLDSSVRDACRNAAVTYLQRALNGKALDAGVLRALGKMADGDDVELASIAKKAIHTNAAIGR